jgi:hypothetical protein
LALIQRALARLTSGVSSAEAGFAALKALGVSDHAAGRPKQLLGRIGVSLAAFSPDTL